jgi:hypothetical protein
MMLYRAAAELQLAILTPGGNGDVRRAAGHQLMSDEGIRQPDHMSAFLMFA